MRQVSVLLLWIVAGAVLGLFVRAKLLGRSVGIDLVRADWVEVGVDALPDTPGPRAWVLRPGAVLPAAAEVRRAGWGIEYERYRTTVGAARSVRFSWWWAVPAATALPAWRVGAAWRRWRRRRRGTDLEPPASQQ